MRLVVYAEEEIANEAAVVCPKVSSRHSTVETE
jgi:hypothetical protein